MTPAERNSTPSSASPAASCEAMCGPDSRVSMPIRTRGLGSVSSRYFPKRPRDPVEGCVVQRVRAGNTANAVRAEQFLGHRG